MQVFGFSRKKWVKLKTFQFEIARKWLQNTAHKNDELTKDKKKIDNAWNGAELPIFTLRATERGTLSRTAFPPWAGRTRIETCEGKKNQCRNRLFHKSYS